MKNKKIYTYLLALLLPLCSLCAEDNGAISLNHTSIAKQLSKEFASIAKKAYPAVVSIHTEYPVKETSRRGMHPMEPFQDEFFRHFFGIPETQEPKRPRAGLGSGFVVSKDGYILTNNHVVDEANKITVVFSDGKEMKASVVGTDASTDIALLKIDAENLEYLTLGDSDLVEVGELVMAVGSPFHFQSTVTMGIVSAKGRSEIGAVPIENFIQTDAAINVGNSGGCLISMSDGAVIGMNTAIISNTGGYVGIGFAIPCNIIKHVMKQLQEKGRVERGYVGVVLQALDAKLAEAFNIDKNRGVILTEIAKDSPAEKAGLKAGDIVLKLDQKMIENPGSLRSMIAMIAPGSKVSFTILRNNEKLEVSCTIGVHPESEMASQDIQKKLGMLFQEMTPEIAKELGYENDEGVLIKYVDPYSNAQEAGLRRGQLIVSINQKKVTTPEELLKTLQDAEVNKLKRILLQVKYGQNTRYVALEIE